MSGTKPPLAVSVIVAALLVAAMGLVRLGLLPHVLLPIGYGVPVVIVSVFRNRRLLWATVAAFAVLTIIKFTMFFPAGPAPQVVSSERWLISLILIDLLIVGALADVWISTQERLQHRNRDLETANSELAAREEEIARQNEELQSQTEELERQSEELRLSNDELLRREKTLEVLLSLSRSLTTELSRGDMMTRICETLSLVVDGTSAASAILEQDGDLLRVRCHHGFGPKGIAREILPTNQSFASLVLSRGRTGYLEDIGLRPDLKIVQPAEGPLMVGVLAVPLRVGAWPIGTLEIFSRQKTRWTDEQIALVESLAAQTSVSLEAAQLFESVQIERHRFETVLRTVPLALVTANADATDIRVNPAAAVLFNVPADVNVASEIGRGSAQLFRDGRELPPGEDLILQAVRNGREVQREELELLNPGGKRVFVLGNARPIRDDQGKINGAVAAYVDITPLKELQRELDLRRREAEEASVRKTRFLAAVSHDIRTPANAISLLAELVRRTAANPAMAGEIPELARELHISSISLVNLLSDVLDIARFDSGKVELQESEFSLVSLLEEEHRQMSPLARERKLTFSFVRPAQPVWVRADRIKLGRILGNLVGNAIKFTEAGEIRLEGELSADGAVRIRVIDTGIGIAPEHLRHIFDEFFQLRNPERDRNKGTGLGLTICKRLVDAMGGALEVQSDVERGSVFTVLLPSSVIVPLGHSSVSKSREETDAAGNGGSLAQSDLC